MTTTWFAIICSGAILLGITLTGIIGVELQRRRGTRAQRTEPREGTAAGRA